MSLSGSEKLLLIGESMDTSNNPAPVESHPKRLPQLDALRGIAALWVVLFHWTVRYDELYGHADTFSFTLPDGRHGVHLFFMISGYVILMTLDRVKSIHDFVVFRFARLYPTLWTCGLITLLVVSLFGLPGRGVTLKDALMNITMLPYFFGFKFIVQSYWSLEVELFFYVLMAAIVGFGMRRHLVLILALLVVCNIGTLLWPGSVVKLPGVIKLFRLLFSLRYLHLFLFGVVCYEMTRARHGWNYPLLALCLAVPFFEESLSRGLVILTLGLLFWVGTQRQVSILHNRVLLYVGLISYPLYLLHQNIGYVIIRESYQGGLPGIAGFFLAGLLVFPLAGIVSSRIELPVNLALRGCYKKWF